MTALLAPVFFVLAQTPGLPTQTGPASIVGSVTVEGTDTSTLVVVAIPEDASRRTGPLGEARLKRSAVTDGQFELGGLPADTYRVTAADADALAAWPAPELLERLAERGMPVPVTPGERVEVELTLSAEPGIRRVTGGRMMLSRMVLTGPGAPMPDFSLPGMRGRQGGAAGAAGAGAAGARPPRPAGRSSISGRVTADGAPVPGVAVNAMRWLSRNGVREPVRSGEGTTTDDDGRFELQGLYEGEYLVAAFADGTGRESITGTVVRHLPAPAATGDGGWTALTTTFHPADTSASEGATIVLGDGDHQDDVDIRMARVDAAVVSGRFVDPDGRTINGLRAVLQSAVAADRMGGANVRAVANGTDGQFEFDGVPFGDYLLSGMGPREAWSEHLLRVGRVETEHRDFRLEAPVLLSGRVEFAGPAPAPDSLDGFFVSLMAAQLRTGVRNTRVPVREDGSFQLQAAYGSDYRLEVEGPDPWRQVFGYVGSQDTLARPITLNRPRDDARAVLASADTSVSVALFDETGRPYDEGRVVIFPVDSGLRRGGSQYIHLARASRGQVTASLPPGDYYVAAGTHIAPEGRIAMSELIPLEETATRFTLTLGEQKAVALTIRR